MKIGRENIEELADLSKLNLTEEEIELMVHDMNNVLLFINKLDELDTSNVEPMDQVVVLKNVFREDEVISTFDRERLLKGAPSIEDGCFKVPRVVE
ncbi:MAG TPA: Asp-tRNA(Asn)/Glu-tRNA(Gln) amidotransferase subunit GatC [Clostridiaceae bacterium]|nr:Asp-tRNA(Asn)/Glu-tRNA(Gln) amidotransferase subunit GatC [Clostridiaceae bacterium]